MKNYTPKYRMTSDDKVGPDAIRQILRNIARDADRKFIRIMVPSMLLLAIVIVSFFLR
jgi:hypothetical protein